MTIPWSEFKQKIPDSINQDFLKYKFTYVEETGDLIFNSNGRVAGSLSTRGYLRTYVLGSRISNHWIVWMIHHGTWPKECIDHINGNKIDNRITNLRDVKARVNAENQMKPKGNRMGDLPLGVSLRRSLIRDKYQARIMTNGEQKTLGTFNTPEEAHDAYVKAKRILHEGCTI